MNISAPMRVAFGQQSRGEFISRQATISFGMAALVGAAHSGCEQAPWDVPPIAPFGNVRDAHQHRVGKFVTHVIIAPMNACSYLALKFACCLFLSSRRNVSASAASQ